MWCENNLVSQLDEYVWRRRAGVVPRYGPYGLQLFRELSSDTTVDVSGIAGYLALTPDTVKDAIRFEASRDALDDGAEEGVVLELAFREPAGAAWFLHDPIPGFTPGVVARARTRRKARQMAVNVRNKWRVAAELKATLYCFAVAALLAGANAMHVEEVGVPQTPVVETVRSGDFWACTHPNILGKPEVSVTTVDLGTFHQQVTKYCAPGECWGDRVDDFFGSIREFVEGVGEDADQVFSFLWHSLGIAGWAYARGLKSGYDYVGNILAIPLLFVMWAAKTATKDEESLAIVFEAVGFVAIVAFLFRLYFPTALRLANAGAAIEQVAKPLIAQSELKSDRVHQVLKEQLALMQAYLAAPDNNLVQQMKEKHEEIQKATSRFVQDEAFMSGSTFATSAKRELGAITCERDDGTHHVIGVFFRVGEYLVTAAHVINVAYGVSGDKNLVSLEKRKKATFLDPKSFVPMCFGPDDNVAGEDYDLYMVKLPAKDWAKLAIGKAAVKADSRYDQTIMSTGFNGDVLVAASGRTLSGSGVEEIWHSASTLKGFSGSPLYCGKNVIAMHVGSAGEYNRGLRIEVIKEVLDSLPADESNLPDEDEDEESYKHEGRSVKFERMRNGRDAAIDEQGRVVLNFKRMTIEEKLSGMQAGNPAFIHWAEEQDWDSMKGLTDRQRRRALQYLDESNEPDANSEYSEEECDELPPATAKSSQESSGKAKKKRTAKQQSEQSVSKKTTRNRRKKTEAKTQAPSVREKKTQNESSTPAYARVAQEKPVNCNSVSDPNEEFSAYVVDKMEDLKVLGYEEEKYAMPTVSKKSEETSLKKHLQLYQTRVDEAKKKPTVEEMQRATQIVVDMLAENKFLPDAEWDSKESIIRVINSTAIKTGKSPGHPYQGDGMATNGDVLKSMTTGGFADMVKQKWSETEIELKTFIKVEPTTRKKNDASMPRIVTGMPLHQTVKNVAVFGTFSDALVNGTRKSPVKMAFNPQKPGDIEHLAEVFQGKPVYESDKTNWDYNVFEWVYDGVRDVVKELALRPAKMSAARFEEYLKDIDLCFETVKNAKYRCTNGNVYKLTTPGCMKSGWYMTIAVNSIAQLYVHVLAALRADCTPEQIKSEEFAFVSGGDDVLQTFPDEFKVERYQEETRSLGFNVTDFKKNDSLDGAEFYSNKLVWADDKGLGPRWEYHPTRFTKHVQNLLRVRTGDLAQAIASAMLNHAWDDKKYEFLYQAFMEFREGREDQFPLSLCRKQKDLQHKVRGLE